MDEVMDESVACQADESAAHDLTRTAYESSILTEESLFARQAHAPVRRSTGNRRYCLIE